MTLSEVGSRTVVERTRSPLHVRLATWDDDPPLGGQGVYIRELRSALRERGTTVSTVAGRGTHAISYPRLTGRGHLDLDLALHLSQGQLLEGEPDLVHVSGGPGGLMMLRKLPVPVVYTAHHTHVQSGRQGPARRTFARLEAAAYKLARKVIAVSPSTAKAVVSMGVPASRVTVVSPGIRFPDDSVEVERQRGRMLFVGRLDCSKGPLDAVAAMIHICGIDPEATAMIVGEGPMEQKVRDAIASAGYDRIKFFGHLADAEVERQYRMAEVVLMPSSFEGLGMVALEAMANGAVVVAYDVEGLHDTVGPYGTLVPPGEVAELAEACRNLLVDDHLRTELAATAMRTVRVERSWERCAGEVEAVYREVVG